MIVKASAWSIAGSLIEKVLLLVAYVIVTRQVDKIEFGLLVLVLLFTELLAYVAGMGISQNIIRAEKLGDDFMTSNKHFNRLVAAALTGVMLLILAPGAYYFHSAELAKLTLIMAFYPALPALASFYMAIMRRNLQVKNKSTSTVLDHERVKVPCEHLHHHPKTNYLTDHCTRQFLYGDHAPRYAL